MGRAVAVHVHGVEVAPPPAPRHRRLELDFRGLCGGAAVAWRVTRPWKRGIVSCNDCRARLSACSRIEQLRLLSKLEQSGLLSVLEKQGVTLSKLEQSG